MLTGSISSLGREYVISLDAVSAATGDSLGREQAQASRKEDVLNALGKATSAMRQKLGESLTSVQKFDKPLEEATTSCRDSRCARSLGRARELLRGSEDTAARLNLKEAVADNLIGLAIFSGLCEDRQGANQLAGQALTLARPYWPTNGSAIAYAIAGQDSKAQALAEGIARDRPEDTSVQLRWSLVQAFIALNHAKPSRALQLLRPASVYDATWVLLLHVRAISYLKSGKAQEAVQDFQHIRNLHSYHPDDPIISLAYVGQARGYQLLAII